MKTVDIDKVVPEVKKTWEEIREKFLPENIDVDLALFQHISDGISFTFRLPYAQYHHFEPVIELPIKMLDAKDMPLRKRLLKEIGEKLIEKIGKYKIAEEENCDFKNKNHYNNKALDHLHQDEDLLLDAAQAMVVGYRFPNYERDVDKNYRLLPGFTKDQFELIKVIYKKMVNRYDLKNNRIGRMAFDSSWQLGQPQKVALTFELKNGHHAFVINLFANQINKFASKFANKGYGNDEAIYFVIREYLQWEVERYNPLHEVDTSDDKNAAMLLPILEDEKASFKGIVSDLNSHSIIQQLH
ncbi:hypothetical protein [Lactobacillus apis]|uniref:Uncharacterized protein n=1 Tax=Lactobacillus apis TaxID=303541 RepID=A0A0F4LL86_9LACO|nr:hypothetical protein [Lactobacillus apis]KJY59607.1 hypothetical protein JF72_14380 [Lactobacillus apis]